LKQNLNLILFIMMKHTNRWFFLLALGMFTFTACQKEQENPNQTQPTPTPPTTPTTPAVTEADKIKDTALLVSRDIYLWYDQIPNTFQPRTYAGPNEVMTAIRQYSIEPGFPKAVDRWSFAVKQTEWDNVSSGIAGDFGLNVFFIQDGDLRVRNVEPLSPAGRAGVRRGWRIKALNGSDNIQTSNSTAIVNAVYRSNNTQFKFEKPDGTTTDINLAVTEYQEQPVALDTVYNTGGKKIGYMVFNSFLGDTTQIMNRFQQSFSRFATQGVNDLVVDLRYNGGGYVSLQDRLAGYILPQSANGDVLMTQKYNDKYSRFNRETKVRKMGSLNLPRVFLIVSDNSASASELLINNLKPYMDVKLVGPSNTYGKPVGYFAIPVGDWYVFPVSSRSTNKLGQGNYFDGFAVDRKVSDGIDKDWGDLNESCLASVVRYITTGNYGPRIAPKGKLPAEEDPRIIQANQALFGPSFKGMILSGQPPKL
jgi:carboxyl-terminal processing protease